MTEGVDYTVSAELYATGPVTVRGGRYIRFPSFAEAIRYALEQVPDGALRSIVIEAGDARYDGKAIRALYYAPGYPLSRG